MAKEIKMPQLSDTMDSGKILNWYKKEGDAIERGDILAEVETDKANLEIESFDTGTLLKIAIGENETAQVGSVIAVIGEAGEAVEISNSNAAPKETAPAAVESEPAPTPTSSPAPTPTPAVAATSSSTTNYASSERIKASPLAKKIAVDRNIDLSNLQGSGPNGRIIRKDLESNNHVNTVTSSPAPTQTIQPSVASVAKVQTPRQLSGELTGTSTGLDKMRSTIARRMQESMQQSPHFYMTTVVNMVEAKKLREGLKVKDEFKGLSLNHFIIKATGNALAKAPEVNAAMRNDELFQPDQVNIGVITAVPNGLLIPVIREVDKAGLMDVAVETRAAITRARDGKPSPSDLSGGTFSISNMGMFDVENFTAIINPGQGGILAVSSMKEKPVVANGELTVGLEMKVTLSVDHRIVDGIAAASFLKHFKEHLEFPALLLV